MTKAKIIAKRRQLEKNLLLYKAKIKGTEDALHKLRQACKHPDVQSQLIMTHDDSWTEFWCSDCGWRRG